MIMVPSTDMQITTIGQMTLTDETHLLTPEIVFSAIPRALLCYVSGLFSSKEKKTKIKNAPLVFPASLPPLTLLTTMKS